MGPADTFTPTYGAWLGLAWACLYMGTVEEGLGLAEEAIAVCHGDLIRTDTDSYSEPIGPAQRELDVRRP